MDSDDGGFGSLAFGEEVNNGGFEVVEPLEKSSSEFFVVGGELDEFFRDAQRHLLDVAVEVGDFLDGLLDEGSGGLGRPLVDDSDGGVGLVDSVLGVGASAGPFFLLSGESSVGGSEDGSVGSVLGVSGVSDVDGFGLLAKGDRSSSLEVFSLSVEEHSSVSELVGDNKALSLGSSVNLSDVLELLSVVVD